MITFLIFFSELAPSLCTQNMHHLLVIPNVFLPCIQPCSISMVHHFPFYFCINLFISYVPITICSLRKEVYTTLSRWFPCVQFPRDYSSSSRQLCFLCILNHSIHWSILFIYFYTLCSIHVYERVKPQFIKGMPFCTVSHRGNEKSFKSHVTTRSR